MCCHCSLVLPTKVSTSYIDGRPGSSSCNLSSTSPVEFTSTCRASILARDVDTSHGDGQRSPSFYSESIPLHSAYANRHLIALGFYSMIFMASRPIRNAAYQTFLIQHIFVWFIIVPSLVIHRPQEQGWIWAG